MSAFIAKPSDDIPDDEWQALPLSYKAFAEFVYEVFDYFNVIVRDTLGWTPEHLRINQGRNNVVIGFEAQGQPYLFRVPKHGPEQLKRYEQATQRLGHFDFFTEQVYLDQQCMIEHFAPGANLNQEAPEEAYIALAKALNQIHCQTATGFGPMGTESGMNGMHRNATEHYFPPMSDAIDMLTTLKPDQAYELQRLFQQWQLTLRSLGAEVVLCHGDLWSDNVLYDVATAKLTLIDWDTFGVYHREKDLHFLLSEEVPSACKKAFFEHYHYPVNPMFMSWYRLTMNLIYYKPERDSHLVEAANHFFVLMECPERLVGVSASPSRSEQGE